MNPCLGGQEFLKGVLVPMYTLSIVKQWNRYFFSKYITRIVSKYIWSLLSLILYTLFRSGTESIVVFIVLFLNHWVPGIKLLLCRHSKHFASPYI